MNATPVNIGTRLASMILDHLIMSILIAILIAPFAVTTVTPDVNNRLPTPAEMLGTGRAMYMMLIGLSIYLCKDCIGGRSIAKRIMRQQVLDNKTNVPATPLQCLLRNFSIVFWPIEVLVVLFSPDRRLGDRLAGTKVVPFNRGAQAPATKYAQVLLCLLLGFAYLFLLTKPLH